MSLAQAKALFEQILEHPSAQHAAILNGLAIAPELKAEVRALLAAHSTPSPLDLPVSEHLHTPGPQTIGPYRILKPIGHGGMATVYLAIRDDGLHDQAVAIKVLHRVHDSPDLQRRFATEIKALAQLDHPNIVRLLDGGVTPGGAFYLVMEYVEQSSWPQPRANILNTFVAVCRAVAHAHRNLIIHRDLKPANILVTSAGVPKLLDFGIAKILDPTQDETTATVLNRLTPQYASPEQLQSKPVTTATDIYSLGVILFELLTGRLPYRETDAPHQLAAQIIEHPPLRARSLNPAIPIDLEAILNKALRKEPHERYLSADALIDDLERYRNSEPVHAHTGSAIYTARKFVRRNRTGLAVATLFLALVAAGLIITTRQLRRAQGYLNDVAQLSFNLLREVEATSHSGRQADVLRIASETTEMLGRLAAENPRNLELQRHRLLALLEYGDLLGAPGRQNAGRIADANTAYRSAVGTGERLFAIDPANILHIINLTRAYNALGYMCIETGCNLAETEKHFRRAVEVSAGEIEGDAETVNHRRQAHATSLVNISQIRLRQNDVNGALAIQKQVLAERRKAVETERRTLGHRYTLAGDLAMHAETLLRAGRLPDAITSTAEAVSIMDDVLLILPDRLDLMDRQANHLALHGNLLLRAERHRDAVAPLDRAVAIARRLPLLNNPANRLTLAKVLAAHVIARAKTGVPRSALAAQAKEAHDLADSVILIGPANKRAHEEARAVQSRIQSRAF